MRCEMLALIDSSWLMFLLLSAFKTSSSSSSSYQSQYVQLLNDGSLQYKPYNKYGDTIIDFSRVGYRHGDASIPDVPVVTKLKPVGNFKSDVANIQHAIDSMANQPLNNDDGFRGAILLEPGEYSIDSTIYLNISGVVLRGSGMNSTILFASGKFPYNVIEIGNSNISHRYFRNRATEFTEYVKIGTTCLKVPNAKSTYKPGDYVFIYARKNGDWIQAHGMDKLKLYAPENQKFSTVNWEPFRSRQDRIVTAVSKDSIEIDVPLVEAIDPKWGGGFVRGYFLAGLVDHVGVEDLSSYSYFDKNVTLPYSGSENTTRYYADENHAGRFLIFYGVFDGFARRVSGKYFNHFISVQKYSKRITISEAQQSEPVSKLDDGRRYAFHVHKASEVLFEHCHSSGARHAFVFNSYSTGPNVFYNCSSENDFGSSEPHERWSTGALYDNCNGEISVQNRLYYGNGHGWGGANFVAWNTRGTLQLHSTVSDINFAIGHVGTMQRPDFAFALGGVDGVWEHHGVHVEPKSLYLAQRFSRQVVNHHPKKPA